MVEGSDRQPFTPEQTVSAARQLVRSTARPVNEAGRS
jgi:hypothetical protein